MSVVVYDGKSLAADRQITIGDLRVMGSKMRVIIEGGKVLAWTGHQDSGLAMARWYQAGARPEHWPDCQKGENWSRLIVAHYDGFHCYEHTPEKLILDVPFMAWGAGRDFALGALAMGATARQAVEVACRFSVMCGGGVEAYELGAARSCVPLSLQEERE